MNFQHWVIVKKLADLNTFDVGFYAEEDYEECKAPSVSELWYLDTNEVIYGRVWI